ncbi:MAG: Gldg family protein [Leptonema sp. (in: bacteria)]
MSFIKNIFGIYGIVFHIMGLLLLFISFPLLPNQVLGFGLLFSGILVLLVDWYFLFINYINKKNFYYFFIIEVVIFVIFFAIFYLEVPILKEEKNQFWKNLKTFLTFLFLTGIFFILIWRIISNYDYYIKNLEKSSSKIPTTHYLLRILSLFVLLVFLNLFLYKWDYSIDLTPGYYTFSKKAQEILKSIKDQNIKIFVFLPDQQLVQSKRDTTSAELFNFSEELKILFKSITTINPSISVEFHNADLMENNSLSFGNVMNGTIILRNYSKSIEKIPYTERRVYVLNSVDLENLEQNLIRSLLQIADNPIKIYFSTEYGERFTSYQKKPYDLDYFIDILKIYNFEVYEWNQEKGFPSKIPEDCQILIFSGPTEKISKETREQVIEFIEKKRGKVVFFINPEGKEDFAWIFEAFSPNYIFLKDNLMHIENKPNLIYTDQIANLELAQNFKNIERKRFLLFGRGYFEKLNLDRKPKYEGYDTKEFLFTPFHTWIDKIPNKKKDKEEKNQRFPLGLLIEKGDSKIVMISDIEWLSNKILTENLYNLNTLLGTDILFYVSNRMNIPGILEKKRENQNIMISETDNIKIFVLGILVLPISLSLITLALVYYYNKRHKFKKAYES